MPDPLEIARVGYDYPRLPLDGLHHEGRRVGVLKYRTWVSIVSTTATVQYSQETVTGQLYRTNNANIFGHITWVLTISTEDNALVYYFRILKNKNLQPTATYIYTKLVNIKLKTIACS